MKKFTVFGCLLFVSSFLFLDCAKLFSTNQHVDNDLSDESIDSLISAKYEFWMDTVMFAAGHAFGYCGDVTIWDGWYFDTVRVGNDLMLSYDSVGPSTLRLSLVTRDLIVDLGDPKATEKIKGFMMPIAGFTRFEKDYEECLDSSFYEGHGYVELIGGFTFEADVPHGLTGNAELMNKFIGELAESSEIENTEVSTLSAFYAGFKPTGNYYGVYGGIVDDINNLSDFLARRTFENWKRGGDLGFGSNEAKLSVKPQIVNDKYVTFSKYEYEREGLGHGMYAETFHSFDFATGKKLTNADIFEKQSLSEVKLKLFEVIAKDPKFLEWHGGSVSPDEIEGLIKAWQSPNPLLEGTEWEAPDREFEFKLPNGALTKNGVVFSFQPYEIDCWAAGAYHFIVPYEKLEAYMTPTAKQLVKVPVIPGVRVER